MRILDKTVDSRLGRRLSTRDSLIGSSPRELERRYGVELRPRAVDADGSTVRFESGELPVDSVIWATGYRPDYWWIDVPVFDDRVGHTSAEASPTCRGSTSWASPGSTRAARR